MGVGMEINGRKLESYEFYFSGSLIPGFLIELKLNDEDCPFNLSSKERELCPGKCKGTYLNMVLYPYIHNNSIKLLVGKIGTITSYFQKNLEYFKDKKIQEINIEELRAERIGKLKEDIALDLYDKENKFVGTFYRCAFIEGKNPLVMNFIRKIRKKEIDAIRLNIKEIIENSKKINEHKSNDFYNIYNYWT